MFHIVDDDLMVGEVLTELICEFGHDVFLFSNPVKYLELIKTPEYVSPVAIFSDVNMPQMNGYDFMHQVKLVNPQQKFVIVTGKPHQEHVFKHLACMYLCKPFAPDSLKTMAAVLMQCQDECCSQDDEHIDDRDRFNVDCKPCLHRFVENEKGK
jgi:two-component SAPR family response regulator